MEPLVLAMNTDGSGLANRSASLPNAANTAGVGGHFLGANSFRAAFSTPAQVQGIPMSEIRGGELSVRHPILLSHQSRLGVPPSCAQGLAQPFDVAIVSADVSGVRLAQRRLCQNECRQPAIIVKRLQAERRLDGKLLTVAQHQDEFVQRVPRRRRER